MKKLALVLLAGVSFATANAQFQFGVKAGANFSTVTGNGVVEDAKTLVNFNAGVYARLPIADRLSLQPELVYSVQGAKEDNGVSHHVNYLNIPILVRYAAGAGFSIFTGPQVGFLMAAHAKMDGNSLTEKSFYNSSDFSWAFGVGYKIPQTKLGIDARYNLGISNIADNDGNGSVRNSVFQLGLTYELFSSGRK